MWAVGSTVLPVRSQCAAAACAAVAPPADAIFQTAQGIELFIDMVTGCFMTLSTMVAHRYIVLRMDMKKVAAAQGRVEALPAATGGKADDSEDEQEERETKVVKAAASSRTRERRKAA